MRNPHGTPIWYELLTKDPLAARRFYESVVGWQIEEQPAPTTVMDYRMVNAAGGPVAGVFRLTDEMCQQGAAPCWLMYIGVDDVDACAAAVVAAGGSVQLPAFDIEGVGRMALLADPQGAAFYVMRGSSQDGSDACNPDRAGHGAWHELHTTEAVRAGEFYTKQLGWRMTQAMDMGPAGTYQLFAVNGRDAGGIMTNVGLPNPAWLLYFRVDGIEQAAARITAAGGKVVHGPTEVPGGSWIVNGLDPEGAMFALTGTR
jgi:uncharacterized protein